MCFIDLKYFPPIFYLHSHRIPITLSLHPHMQSLSTFSTFFLSLSSDQSLFRAGTWIENRAGVRGREARRATEREGGKEGGRPTMPKSDFPCAKELGANVISTTEITHLCDSMCVCTQSLTVTRRELCGLNPTPPPRSLYKKVLQAPAVPQALDETGRDGQARNFGKERVTLQPHNGQQ